MRNENESRKRKGVGSLQDIKAGQISIPISKKSIASGGTNRPSHDPDVETGDEYPASCYLQQRTFSPGLGRRKSFNKGRASLLTTPRDHIIHERVRGLGVPTVLQADFTSIPKEFFKINRGRDLKRRATENESPIRKAVVVRSSSNQSRNEGPNNPHLVMIIPKTRKWLARPCKAMQYGAFTSMQIVRTLL
ncbi:hypothetical protein VNO77_44751 [Canavalia gladiata]|uniref:Uncharacterized protein n=1 Tax=Canavalia gladiata TaxID=3824 RepID=A0AAN9JYS5_CANGL